MAAALEKQKDRLLKRIQAAFEDVHKLAAEIEHKQKEMKTSLESIENLSEQLQCTQKVSFINTPLAKFPELQEKLSFKIATEIESHVKSLQDQVGFLKSASESMKRHNSAILDVYKNCPDLTVVDVEQGEPMRPAISTMIQWLHDYHQFCHILYASKLAMLNSLDYRESKHVQNLVQNWLKENSLLKKVTENKPYLQYFMQEKFDNT